MSDQWYYRLLGEEFGPVPMSTLQTLASAGSLSADDEVRAAHSKIWIPVEAIIAGDDEVPESNAQELSTSQQTADDEFLTDLSEIEISDEHELSTATDINEFDSADSSEVAEIQQLTALAESIDLADAEDADDDFEVAGIPGLEKVAQTTDSPKPHATGSAPVAVDTTTMWCYQMLGEEFGPIGFLDLQDMATDGELSPTDLIRPHDASEWIEARQLSGLEFMAAPPPSSSAVAAPTAAPPPPPIPPGGPETAASAPMTTPTAPAPAAPSPPASPPLGNPAPGPVTAGLPPAIVAPGSPQTPAGAPIYIIQYTGGPGGDAGDKSSKTGIGPAGYPEDPLGNNEKNWYCWIDQNEYGPITFRDAVRWFLQERLGPSDYLRFSEDGNWLVVSQIPELIEAAAQEAQKAADREAKLKARQQQFADLEEKDDDKPKGSQGAGTTGTTHAAANAFRMANISAVRNTGAARRRAELEAQGPWQEQLKDKWEEIRRNPTAMAGLGGGVVLLLGYLVMSFLSGGNNTTMYMDIETAYNEFLELRTNNASQDQWSEFIDRSEEVILPMMDLLSKTASTKQPARQHMLWALRDYWPIVVDQCREQPNTSEVNFARELAEAHLILQPDSPPPEIPNVQE